MTCPGLLVENQLGFGDCELGPDCTVLSLRSDYSAYRGAHERITAAGTEEEEDLPPAGS
jgi:hypothetical protein